MKKLCLLIAVLVAATVARAFSFSVTVPSGQTLYFDITSSSTVSVVAPDGNGWGDYTTRAGRLQIPAQVSHQGTTYNVTAIGNNALRECDGLTSVTLPSSVRSIGYTAFFRSTALTSVHMVDGLETIGRMAFAACSALDTIEMPSTLTQIGISAFNSTAYEANTANWYNGMLSVGEYLIAVSSAIDSTVTVLFPTRGIANGAFYYCHNMPKVVLPEQLQFIGNLAFSDCEVLDTVVMHATVPPTLGDDAFTGVPSVTVVVPCGTGAAYRSAQYWSALNIVEDSCHESVESVDGQRPSVAVCQGGIVVSGAQGAVVAVRDLLGRTVAMVHGASALQRLSLPAKGIYIVSVDGATAAKVAAYWK